MLNIISRGGKYQIFNYWIEKTDSTKSFDCLWQIVCSTEHGEVVLVSYKSTPNDADPDNAFNMVFRLFENMIKNEREQDGVWMDLRNLSLDRL